jgi:hypothetical protein
MVDNRSTLALLLEKVDDATATILRVIETDNSVQRPVFTREQLLTLAGAAKILCNFGDRVSLALKETSKNDPPNLN